MEKENAVMYDIVFISYNEPLADHNYKQLCERFPIAQRVKDVKGIHQAHIEAAKLALTKMFWVVDGDAVIEKDFMFDYAVPEKDLTAVHVWRSRNPINDLQYGYGGVKLLPRRMTLEMNTDTTDMTTSISNRFRAMEQVSNITAFNSDPFNAWKSAFRECVKLSSRVIDRQEDQETEKRLDAWCTLGANRPYGDFAMDGAQQGKKYGEQNKNNPVQLKLINDFDWLQKYFKETCSVSEYY